MPLPASRLLVKRSTLPGAGKGLFTRVFIPKGTRIVEYKGKVTTWKEVEQEIDNDYLYYYNSRHVINAKPYPKALARYANDAQGLVRVKGIVNNCVYEKADKKAYITSTRDIPAGAEILVSYKKEYWQQARINARVDAAEQKAK